MTRRVLTQEAQNITFETSEEVEVTPTFDSLSLREDLIRGIYAYGEFLMNNYDKFNLLHLAFNFLSILHAFQLRVSRMILPVTSVQLSRPNVSTSNAHTAQVHYPGCVLKAVLLILNTSNTTVQNSTDFTHNQYLTPK